MTGETHRIIEDECRKLSIAYARHVDFKEYDLFVKLFTPEGELNVTGRPVVGHEKLKKAMAMRPDSLRSRHVLTNIYIYLSSKVLPYPKTSLKSLILYPHLCIF